MFLTTLHKQKCLAQMQAATNNESGKVTAASAVLNNIPEYLRAQKDVIFAALQQDLDALHSRVDIATKIELKKTQLIPKWKAVVDEYRASGAMYPFEPLMYFIIWLLDAEQIDVAIDYADFAIQQQQPMPERFNRTLDTFAAETIHDWAQRQYKEGHSAEPYLNDVINRIETRAWLVNEPIVLNKLYKQVALYAEKVNDLVLAEKAYLKCVEVNPVGHGVKTKLAAVQEKLGKQLP